MDSAPGTPQLQNIIPTVYLGTTIYAAPTLGTICGLMTLALCYIYINWRKKVAEKHGEGYGNHTLNEATIDPDQPTPPWYFSILPLITVLAVKFLSLLYLQMGSFYDRTVPKDGIAFGDKKRLAALSRFGL